MDNKENKCTALIKPDYVDGEIVGELVQKQEEFEDALAKGKVRDPISLLISAGISIAVSLGSSLIARAFAPKPKPVRQGELSGEVQGLMRSEQGILIPEIYGADVGDGKGGVKIPATIIWAIKPRKNITISRQSTGGGKGFGGSRNQEVENVEYDIDFAAMGGRGPLVLKREWANADRVIDLDKRGYYEGEDSSNTFTAPYVITNYQNASNGQDVTLQGNATPTAAVQFNAVVSNGAATRDLTIYYVNTATFNGELIVNGGTPQTISFPNSSDAYSSIIVSVALNNGNNTIKIRNLATSPPYNLRIDRIFVFPGFSETDRGTGILDPTIPADTPYNPSLPPDPTVPDLVPRTRHNDVPTADAYGVRTGNTAQAGYSDFAIYSGNEAQLPDPVIEAAVGVGLTPAYRKRAYVRHSAFKLTRWGGTMPNITQLWEHETLKTLAQICAQWCDRVGMETTDYDFSGISTVKVRGLLVSGRRYAPKDVMEEAAEVYDCFFTEAEGKVVALLQTNAPTITIPETEIGWVEKESEGLPSIDSTLANEIDLPRRVDVKFIDPDREYEPNTQGEARQITEGKSEELLEVGITLTASEARAVATRKLYRSYVRGTTRRFTLSWTYAFLYPGCIVNTTKNGISISTQITSIKGGIGLREIESQDVQVAVFTQSNAADSGTFEQPPVPIPAMTICALLDVPLLRDRDATENNGAVIYGAATPRTSEGQMWTGSSLYVFKAGSWERIADFTLPGTMGRIVSFANLSTSTSVFDRTGEIVFDLYHTDKFIPTLSSAPEADVLAGANALAINTPQGWLITQFATATQVSANRWKVTTLLHGRKDTEHLLPYIAVNRAVVFLNEAVQAIPMNLNDLNRSYDYKMVSSGASLDDSATLEDEVWTGKSLQPPAVIITAPAPRDSGNDLLIEPYDRSRVGGGLRSYQAGATHEEKNVFKAQILNSGSTILPNGRERTLTFDPKMPTAAFLISSKGGFTGVTHNSFVPPSNSLSAARTIQEIPQTDNYMEGAIHYNFLGNPVGFGLQKSGGDWSRAGIDLNNANLNLVNTTLTGTMAMPYLVIIDSITFGGSFGNRLHVYEYGTRIFSASSLPGQSDYDGDFGWLTSPSGMDVFRVRFNFIGSSVVIQKAHTANVPLKTIVTGKRAVEFPLFGVACGPGDGDVGVLGIFMTTYPHAKTIYAGSQQTEDFGSAQANVQMDVWKESPVVGPGVKTRITL